MRSRLVAVCMAAAVIAAGPASAQTPDEQSAMAAELEQLRNELEAARVRLEEAARNLASRAVPAPSAITSVYTGGTPVPSQENRVVVLPPRMRGIVVESAGEDTVDTLQRLESTIVLDQEGTVVASAPGRR